MAENAVILPLAKAMNAFRDEGINFGISSLFNIILALTFLPTRMKSIENELLVMKKFLSQNQIHLRKSNDEAFNAWLEQVRKLAYRIEDTIDEYVFLVHKQSGKGFFNFVKRVFNIPFTLLKMWNIALRLKRLKIELIRISQVKDRWVRIVNNEFNMVSEYDSDGKINQSYVDDFVKEEELVGIEKNREKLENLIQIEEKSLRVITVWGMGGLGKTTLVNNVYKREIQRFDCHAWISISQSYKIEDLLRKLIVQLYEKKDPIPSDIKFMDNRRLKETLKMFLNHKRYLIVLDDIWTLDVYDKLRNLCPENGLGSRIIITTRMDNMALLANEFCKLEIKALDEYDAYDLFCKRVFWKDKKHLCPPKLDKLARKFVKKCKGLPLALVSIGSLLSRRENSETEWNRVYDQLNWELDNNPNLSNVKHILYLSYNYLPRYLKSCFLYCSMFPEDYIMKRSRLVRLWIAEGFIEERGSSNLEEIAEGYLSELIQRSLLQLVEKNSFGGLRKCKMHDIVRELAISLSKKENFHEICDENNGVQAKGEFGFSYTRRLSVINSTNGIESRDNNMPHVRSFIAFNISMFSPILLHSIFLKSRFLTVLDLQGLPIETIPKSIGDLLNLKCLHLRRTNVRSLPEAISNLCNLQTLDLTETKVEKLPCGLEKLNKLRHLFAWRCTDETYRSFDFCKPVNEIKGLVMLKNLRTLVAVEATEKIISQLGKMNQLRSLCVTNLRTRFCLQLCKSLKEHRFLTRLEIFSRHEDEILQLEYLNPLPPNLKKLLINGRLAEGTLDSPFFRNRAKNLEVFDLGWSQLEENPFLSLSRLSWLTTMRLVRVYNGNNICFQVGWFPNLKILFMKDFLNVDKVVFEEGTLMNLACLRFEGFKELKDLPNGIEFLKSLEKLFLLELHTEFRSRWKKLDVLKILKNISILQIE